MLISKIKPAPESVRLSGALSKLTSAGLLALATVCLASCVASEMPLVVGSKPVLGPQFDMVLYRDFAPGKGYDAQEVKYRWLDGSYVRSSTSTKQFVRLTAEPLGGDDLLVQRSRAERADASSNLYDYWIARKVIEGTYLFFPLNEHDLTPDERSKSCSKDQAEGFCVMNNHDALLVSARATAGKPIRNPSIGILVDEGVREGKSDSLDRGPQ